MRASILDIDIEAELARFQARRVKHRSPGLHLSEIIRHIITTLKLKPGKYGGKASPLTFHQGFLWEDVLSWVLGKQLGMRQIEVEQDGIYLTLDGFNTREWRTREAKATKISSSNPITGAKFWPWHVQMMAGCRAMETRECELVVLFVNGGYEMARLGEWVGKAWLMEFSQREIEENWRMILRARDRIGREE